MKLSFSSHLSWIVYNDYFITTTRALKLQFKIPNTYNTNIQDF